MVDFDLRDLSAPIEELRSDVNAAYKCLDAKWDAVTKALSKLPIPCDVGYTFEISSFDPLEYSRQSSRIEWRKWNGKKRICIVKSYEDDEELTAVIPYEEWSAEQRINILEHVPKLFKAAAEQTKAFIAKAQRQEERI